MQCFALIVCAGMRPHWQEAQPKNTSVDAPKCLPDDIECPPSPRKQNQPGGRSLTEWLGVLSAMFVPFDEADG